MAFAVALRLVTQSTPDRESAARRLVTAAPAHGIDLTLAWGNADASGERIRQVCLGVPGAGRTIMLYVSEPPPGGDPDGPEVGRAERAAAVSAACEYFEGHPVTTKKSGAAASPATWAAIAQGLPDPREFWAVNAFGDAGFTKVGDLSYLRRPFPARAARRSEPRWPEGIDVEPLSSFERSDREAILIRALDATYRETLDCPELCGMRTTADVLASHMATGAFDPALWWLVLSRGQPSGCLLLSRCPESRSVELVYLGVSPELRGRGIASGLLTMGADRATTRGIDEMTCAVDQRNIPALALYRRSGFSPFGQRVALVRPLRQPLSR